MRNFVVSLAINNEERREHIKQEFMKQMIPFEFFDAVTPQDNEKLLQENQLKDIPTDLTPVEISCFLSHYMIWQKVVTENITYAAVFEDDVYLGEDASTILTSSKWIDIKFDVLKLEKGPQKSVKLSLFPIQKIEDRKIYQLKSPYFGTAGYILSNKGAQFLIKQCRHLAELRPIDVVMFRILLQNKFYRLYQMVPALCIQDYLLEKKGKQFDSVIASSRQTRYLQGRKEIRKSNIDKIKKELLRVLQQIRKALIGRSVKFK